MKRSNNPAGTNPGRTRREALGLLGGGAALLGPLRHSDRRSRKAATTC